MVLVSTFNSLGLDTRLLTQVKYSGTHCSSHAATSTTLELRMLQIWLMPGMASVVLLPSDAFLMNLPSKTNYTETSSFALQASER